MNAERIGRWFVAGGLLLIAAALCLVLYNLNEQNQAARTAAEVLEQLEMRTTPTPDSTPGPVVETELPEYLANPYRDMPVTEIDGQDYVGIVTIPALELSLPVISEWSYPRLRVAPCRFQGSAYLDNLIIMAHNYLKHFGTLINLQPGDEVYFEDMEGNVFRYAVVEMETLAGTDIEDMLAGDWDLTLFTCTVGGKTRVTVRCEQLKS